MAEVVIVGGALLVAAHLMRSALRALRSAAADMERRIADAPRVADFDRWERELQELP